MPRIRVIVRESQPTAAERLEQRARELLRRGRQRVHADPILSIVEGEMAVTLDHLDHFRAVHHQIHRSLLRHECYLGTEILQREPREPVYLDPRLPERDRLRDRLRDIDAERRRWTLLYQRDRQSLLDRLLSLVTRHGQLRVGT